MTAILKKQNDADEPAALLSAYERLYHGMGVLPKTDKLADVFLDLLSSQVGGLYVPSDKKLYVVSKAGGVGPLEKFLYSHEYTHALQDQNFDLQKFQPDSLQDQSDAQLARQARRRGRRLRDDDLLAPAEREPLRPGGRPGRRAATPRRSRRSKQIPPLISSQILFSALQGTVWVLQQQMAGGWDAVNAAFANPPASTEQVLHPEKYASREAPIDVTAAGRPRRPDGQGLEGGPPGHVRRAPAGRLDHRRDPEHRCASGAAARERGRLGRRPGRPPGRAERRVGHRPEDRWDTANDAAEFEAAIAPRVAQAGGPGKVLPGEGDTVRWVVIGSDDQTLAKAANVLGLAG